MAAAFMRFIVWVRVKSPGNQYLSEGRVSGITQNDEFATNLVNLFDFVQFDWYHFHYKQLNPAIIGLLLRLPGQHPFLILLHEVLWKFSFPPARDSGQPW